MNRSIEPFDVMKSHKCFWHCKEIFLKNPAKYRFLDWIIFEQITLFNCSKGALTTEKRASRIALLISFMKIEKLVWRGQESESSIKYMESRLLFRYKTNFTIDVITSYILTQAELHGKFRSAFDWLHLLLLFVLDHQPVITCYATIETVESWLHRLIPLNTAANDVD